ncbi:Ribosomal protein L10 family protein [Raphanus sativus]|nr:Ribosomal protein L10 family protein [Raphanus sativus]
MKGMNAWIFVQTEDIPAALKTFVNFQKEKKLFDSNNLGGAVFEEKLYGPRDYKVIETMPPSSHSDVPFGTLYWAALDYVNTLQAQSASDNERVLQRNGNDSD